MHPVLARVAVPLIDSFPGVYRQVSRRLQRRGVVQGLPPALNHERLDAVCREQRGTGVRTAGHVRLWSWKEATAGTFRIWVRLESGAQWSLIYKRVPATVREGARRRTRPLFGEAILLGRSDDAIGAFLPRVYALDASEAGYWFLTEDLWATHRESKTPSDAAAASTQLPELHRALAETLSPDDALPRHDRAFVQDLEQRAREHLEPLGESHLELPGVRALSHDWERIAESLHAQEFLDPAIASLIHGDLVKSHALLSLGNKPKDARAACFIDWEYLGWGLAEYDLAVLLRHETPRMSVDILETYAREQARPLADVFRRYQWSTLVRSLFEALALYEMSPPRDTASPPSRNLLWINARAARAVRAARLLREGGSEPVPPY